MPITPPLDRIPGIPNKLVSTINKQLSIQINQLTNTVSKTLQESLVLPETAKCDDPAVQKIKSLLESISKQIQDLNQLIPVINQVNTVIKTAGTAAQAIKAIQLLNPVTGPAVLAAELVLVQNTTIANSIQASKQLQSIPPQIESSLTSLAADIARALQNFSNVCNNESFQFPGVVNDAVNSEFNDNILDSEFYREVNVQQDDIDERNELIQQLIDTQVSLLSSIQEAPSQVYNDIGIPADDLGKPGDYYIDTENKVIYGPKVSQEGWPEGVNY